MRTDDIDIHSALNGRFSIHTRDSDCARRHFCNNAGAIYFDAKPNQESFRFDGVFVPFKDVTIGYARFHGAIDLRFPASSFLRQIFRYSGSGRATTVVEREVSASSPYALIPSETQFRLQSSISFSYLVVRFDQAALTRKITALTGKEVKSWPRFTASSISPSIMKLRCGAPAVALLVEQSENLQNTNIAIAELEQSMMINFIVSHFHEYSDFLHGRAPVPSIAQVLKAEEYIAEHWHEPLRIETIASIAGTSARSLFRHFRSVRSQSPLEFIKTIRLQNAHRMLSDKNSPISILGVALKCGYQNASHFARDYKRMYGVLPTQTARHGLQVVPVSSGVPITR